MKKINDGECKSRKDIPPPHNVLFMTNSMSSDIWDSKEEEAN